MKNIMVDNIERVLERGEKIELLVDKTDNLRFQVGARTVPSGVTVSSRAAMPAQPAVECRRLQSGLLVGHKTESVRPGGQQGWVSKWSGCSLSWLTMSDSVNWTPGMERGMALSQGLETHIPRVGDYIQ